MTKRENIVEDIDLGRFFELATRSKKYVNNLNLHEIKNEILQDYTDDFELNGKLIIGVVEHKTIIRFKNMDNINIGCFDGRRINPRNLTQRNTSLFI